MTQEYRNLIEEMISDLKEDCGKHADAAAFEDAVPSKVGWATSRVKRSKAKIKLLRGLLSGGETMTKTKNTDCGSVADARVRVVIGALETAADAAELDLRDDVLVGIDQLRVVLAAAAQRTESGSVAVGSPVHVAVWDAINAYAEACGGDTAGGYGGTRRMDAVVAVESSLRTLLSGSSDMEQESVPQVDVWDVLRDLYVGGRISGSQMDAIQEEYRARVRETEE